MRRITSGLGLLGAGVLVAGVLLTSGLPVGAVPATEFPGAHVATAPYDAWAVGARGAVYNLAGAPTYGSVMRPHLNKPVVGMVSTFDGGGYWSVASDGGVYSFGDAQFHGSTGNLRLNSPVVGTAAVPDGGGYWLVASDGGTFTFGDARFYGSTGGVHLNRPIVGIAATPDGRGYWLVASDGGIFTFGDAPFFGSGASGSVREAAVGVAATPDGKGYWLARSSGIVQSFGDAPVEAPVGHAIVAVAAVTTPLPALVDYGPGPYQQVLVYPSPMPNSPVVVLVHGGGFGGGNYDDLLIPQEALYLQANDVTVFVPNYQLASPTMQGFPTQWNQIAQAARFARSTAGVANGNGADLSLFGGSAGGTLVAMAAYQLQQTGVPVANVFDFSGPNDFVTYDDWMIANPVIYAWIGAGIEWALGCPLLETCPLVTEQAPSATLHVATQPHWLLANGVADGLVPPAQAQEMAAAVTAHGGRATLVLEPNADHAFVLDAALNPMVMAMLHGG